MARAGGLVAYLLLTLSVALGLALSLRWQRPRWPRLITNEMHSFMTLPTLVFVCVHVAAVWVDPFTRFGWRDVFIPLASAYRPLWLALGIVGLYLLLAVWISTQVRAHRLRLVAASAHAGLRRLPAHDRAWAGHGDGHAAGRGARPLRRQRRARRRVADHALAHSDWSAGARPPAPGGADGRGCPGGYRLGRDRARARGLERYRQPHPLKRTITSTRGWA